eukprot:jgi/Tetstr1/435138/TSEL_024105.t1
MRSASSSVSRGGASSGPVRRWMCAAAAAVLLLGVALLSGARLTWGSGAAAPADLHARGSARRPDDAPCELYGGMPERPAGEAGLPAFLIAGAQKGGTTYLHSLLRQARPAGPRNAERNPPGRVPGISEPSQQPAWADNELPPVYGGNTKELHFFDRANLGPGAFVRGYLPAWHGANASDLLFESSPGYLPTPMAPVRIAALLPAAKVIVILREPASRALSHWNMRQTFCKRADKNIMCPLRFEAAIKREMEALKRAGCAFDSQAAYDSPASWNRCFRCYFEATCDFTEGTMTEPWFEMKVDSTGPRAECRAWSQFSGYVFRGMYAAQLSWWLQHVRPQQLHVINQDDLSAEPQRVLAEVLAFLGVPQDLGLIARLLKGKRGFFKGSYSKNEELAGQGGQGVLPAVAQLQDLFTPHNEQLYTLLDRLGVRGFSRFDTQKVHDSLAAGTQSAPQRLQHRARRGAA